jgi:hypothetical protein
MFGNSLGKFARGWIRDGSLDNPVGDTIGEKYKVADVFVAESRIMMVENSIDDASGQIPVFGNVPAEAGVADSKNPVARSPKIDPGAMRVGGV